MTKGKGKKATLQEKKKESTSEFEGKQLRYESLDNKAYLWQEKKLGALGSDEEEEEEEMKDN